MVPALIVLQEMKKTAVREFRRLGRWSSGYSHLYESAYVYRAQFERKLMKYQKLVASLKETEGIPEEHMVSFLHHETNSHEASLSRSFETAKLYACLAIEGFVNYYSTVRLSEAIFKRLVERMGITEKISLLYLLCFDEDLSAKSEMLKNIRTVFDARNAMVHPKTKEVNEKNLENFVQRDPSEWDIESCFSAMECFIDSICERDTCITRSFYFSRDKEAEQE